LTLEQLNENFVLHQRLERAYDMMESLRDRAGLRAASLSAMPKGQEVSDRVGEIAAAAADLSQRIRELEDLTEQGDAAVRQFANTLPDERVQQTVLLRFVACLSWEKTAELLGPRYSSRGLQKLLRRTLGEDQAP